MGDKLLLRINSGSKFQHYFIISHVKLQRFHGNFSYSINTVKKAKKKKNTSYERNLSPMMSTANQLLYS